MGIKNIDEDADLKEVIHTLNEVIDWIYEHYPEKSV